MTSFQQDLITAAVGGLLGGLIAFGIALFTLRRQRLRSDQERKEQYIVEACWDVVDRAWTATNAAEVALEAGRPWDAYRAFDDLSVQMWGQGHDIATQESPTSQTASERLQARSLPPYFSTWDGTMPTGSYVHVSGRAGRDISERERRGRPSEHTLGFGATR